MTEDRDELLENVVAELQVLPHVDEPMVQRIVARAVREPRLESVRPRAMRTRLWLGIGGLAAAAGIGMLIVGQASPDADAGRVATASAPAAREGFRAAAGTQAMADEMPIATQFVLDVPAARQVALVGDFNGWNADATPLRRDASGLWTATIALRPGRHVYAYVVDGEWKTDPRAETVTDADFGKPTSVVLVGSP